MSRIIRLDEALSNKIAAGEVVERPASIVKELVENSLDAGSTLIQVEVEEGGLNKIKVTDNGSGIDPEDCEIAFQRHATSKIANEQDLFHIRTLGFRGEALPSIASVSHFEILTCTGDGPGKHLVFQGGHLIQSQSTSSRKGTEMIVTNLFYNTPARLKHLKTIHTELANISDIMNKLAMAYPNVSFTLVHNDKRMLNTNGNGDHAQVLSAIYGLHTAKQSIPFYQQSMDFKISGRLVKPEITRAGRQYVYIFINGRYIRNYPIFNAVVAGYHTLLPIGRYPIAMVHIKMDPTLIDINVHPAKLEARISKERELCELVEASIKKAFHKLQLIPEVKQLPKEKLPKSDQQELFFDSKEPEKLYKQENHRDIERQSIQEPSSYDQMINREDRVTNFSYEYSNSNPNPNTQSTSFTHTTSSSI